MNNAKIRHGAVAQDLLRAVGFDVALQSLKAV
jgi:hypothetical protein